MQILFLIVSFLASVAGAICGIGGGVIIKPTLDIFQLASISTVNFLSSCTVLAMSCYSVSKALLSGESKVEVKTGTALALGAAMGGVLGKSLFSMVKALFANANTVGAVQAACLLLVTVGTLLYTLYKEKIITHHIHNLSLCTVIGMMLGVISSFLGIGGGPINLIALFFFFSMDIKTAAQNSLYIILFSQVAGLATTLMTRTVPEFEVISLVLMVAGGILGGIFGRKCNTKMSATAVNKLFIGLMVVIIGISLYNTLQYAGWLG